MYILYISSKPQNKLKFCFTCQLFTPDTIKITNEINTSYFQSELIIFAIYKFRFKTDIKNHSFHLLLLLLPSGDISLNPGPFSNPQLFKQKDTAQKMKFSIKDFFSKCDQIRRKLRVWSHLLKIFLMENFIFCEVRVASF